MKLYKKENSRLSKIAPTAQKAVFYTGTVRRSFRNSGLFSTTIREEGEEDREIRMQLTGQERKTWEKLRAGKKKKYYRKLQESGGSPGQNKIIGLTDSVREGPARGSARKTDPRQKTGHRTGYHSPGQKKAGRTDEGRTNPGQIPDGKMGSGGPRAKYSIKKADAQNRGDTARKAAVKKTAGKGSMAAVDSVAAASGVGAAKKAADAFRRSYDGIKSFLVRSSDANREMTGTCLEKAGKQERMAPRMAWMGAAGFVYLFGKAVLTVGVMVVSVFSILVSILPLFILLLVLLFAASFFVGGGGNGSARIVGIARQELEAAGENIGGYKYKEWYGLDGHWCAMFVTWCAEQCGYISSGIVPRTAAVAELHSWYQQKNQYHNKNEYEPKPGDIILFEGPGRSHTGIVIAYDAAAKVVTTIEGNTRANNHTQSRVTQNSYSISNPDITAFCTPAYPVEVGTLTGDTKAEMVFCALVEAGYTKEAAAAVVGNLAGEGGLDADGDLKIDSTESTGEGVGMCQWSFGRKAAFLSYAEGRGEPWPTTSLSTQINFMLLELSGSQWLWSPIGAEYGEQYHISHEEFKNCKDVVFATTACCANFERPHAVHAHLDVRIAYAQKVLQSFGNKKYQNQTGKEEEKNEHPNQ